MKSEKFLQFKHFAFRKRLPNNITITYFECKLLGCADLCVKRKKTRTNRIYFEMYKSEHIFSGVCYVVVKTHTHTHTHMFSIYASRSFLPKGFALCVNKFTITLLWPPSCCEKKKEWRQSSLITCFTGF